MSSELDKYVAEREAREPGFAALVEAAEQRRAFAREMAERRKKHGLSQTQVAAKMKTSPSIVSRIESGGDVRLSTLEKYLVALGFELTMQARRLPHGAG
ncbi:MAG: helix-turn-helix domain-containing protein [Myxococcota bacterium]